MAENDVILGIALDTKKAIQGISEFQQAASDRLAGIGKAAMAAAAVVGGVFAAGKILNGIGASIDAANEQVNAINKMNQALASSGEYSIEASKAMQDYASSLSSVIAVDDDAILDSIALAKSFGATNEQAKKLVTAAADLSSAMGTDLNSAVSQLGGTLSGAPSRALSKLSPEMKSLSEAALRSGAAIDILGDRFKGTAEAATKTFSGELEKVKLGLDSFQTSIGLIITQNPAVRKLLTALTGIFEKLAKYVSDNSEAISALVTEGIAALISSVGTAAKVLNSLSFILDLVKNVIGLVSKAFVGLGSAVNAAITPLLEATGVLRDGTGDQFAASLQAAYDKISEIQSIDFEAKSSELLIGLANTMDEFKDSLLAPDLIKPIPVEIKPIVNQKEFTKVLSEASQAAAISPFQPTVGDKFEPMGVELPKAGPAEAPPPSWWDDVKSIAGKQENQAAAASSLISAFRQGGKEGAQQVVAAAATGIAAALGAGPFAQVIGELVTFLTTDGAAQLVTSVAENIDDIIFALAENMPQVALALAEAFLNPLFYIRIINAFIDGITTGLDKALKEVAKNFTTLFSAGTIKAALHFIVGIGQAIQKLDFTDAAKRFGEKILGFFDTLYSNFKLIIQPIIDLVNGIRNVGSNTVDKVKSSLGFGLTSGSGTVQRNASYGLSSSEGGPDATVVMLQRILTALEKPTTVKSVVTVDSRAFASIMLDISRKNMRTA